MKEKLNESEEFNLSKTLKKYKDNTINLKETVTLIEKYYHEEIGQAYRDGLNNGKR
jgi:hypothetical protein